MSDIFGTSTMTPGSAAIARSLAKGKKKPNKSKITKITPSPSKTQRKLEPYCPKPPPSAYSTPSTSSSHTTPVQSSFSLKGLVTPSDLTTMDPPSSLNELDMTDIITIKEEELWDIEFSNTERTENTAVKDVKNR